MATTVSDVLFGRLLKSHQYILWASPSAQPDVGGNEPVFAFDCEELLNPDICVPSASRHVCVSLEVNSLPLTAIIHSRDIEDAFTSLAPTSSVVRLDLLNLNIAKGLIPLASTLVDETSFCLEPFKILTYLAENWANDALKNANTFADSLQMNLYRWINNRKSLFFAPALQRHVHKIVCKAFGVLVGKLRQLGAEVLQANLHTMILSTKKVSVDQAQGYCDYLMQAIHEVPCMKYLVLQPTHFWSRLVFLDGYNYAGLKMVEQGRAMDVSVVEDSGNRAIDGMEASQRWDFADHLPRKSWI